MSSIKVFLKDQYFALLNIFDGDDLFYQLGKPLILNYHHIIPDSRVENNLLFGYAHSTTSFESQIKWLAQHFRKSQDFDTQNSFVITFDDCSQHTFELALPVLEKYGMKAYFFMVENTIGTTIWIDRYFFWLSYAPTAKYHLFDKEYTLDNHKSRIAAHHKLWSLYESNIEYSEILDEMEKAYPFSNLETDSNRLEKRLNTLSIEQCNSLKEQGHFIGFHSRNHEQLSKLTKNKLKLECEPQEKSLYNSNTFAIPFGGSNDYDQSVLQEIKKGGFDSILLNHPIRAKDNVFGRLNLPDTSNPLAIQYYVKRYLKSIA